jgi:hypothetical protein
MNNEVIINRKSVVAAYPLTIICLIVPNLLINGPMIAPISDTTDKVYTATPGLMFVLENTELATIVITGSPII